jgi:hypothetical protein
MYHFFVALRAANKKYCCFEKKTQKQARADPPRLLYSMAQLDATSVVALYPKWAGIGIFKPKGTRGVWEKV